MALVQALPVPTNHPGKSGIEVEQCCSVSRSPDGTAETMGSVSSLISGRSHQEQLCRAASEVGARSRKVMTGSSSCFRAQEGTLRSSSSQEQLLNKTHVGPLIHGNGNYGYAGEELSGDWNDNCVTACSPCSDSEEGLENRSLNGNISGPPPKLIPVSGRLEKNMEKTLIRPTAFKPVVNKNRNSVQYLSPRPGGGLSESQGSLNLILPANEKRNSYSGGRNARGSQSCSQSCTLSDSGRNSLSSLPTYSSTNYSLVHGDVPAGHLEQARSTHGHSNSDSGRSSSSKSTGSLSGRGQPLSDSGSCGRSPAPGEGYEGVIRDLEEKLRERDLELQQLRENLDENEAAICQVYEEKQRRCEQEMKDLRQNCSSKMRQASQKAQRAQQVLQLQVFQLQQEKKKLQEDFSALLQERETLERKCASIEREQTQLGPRLEETKWEVCQKSGEISLLKQQLKDVQSDLGQKAAEIVALKAQLREARGELQASQARSQEAHAAARTRTLELEVCENELQRRKSEAELLREKLARLEEESIRLRDALAAPSHSQGHAHGHAQCIKGQSMTLPLPTGRGSGGVQCLVLGDGVEEQQLVYESDEAKAQRQNADALHAVRQQVERLRAELMLERRRSEEQQEAFEEERRIWQEEKEKVIRYQKQLQQNYIQMYRRNRDLERVMRELSLELENRDLEELQLHSNNIHFEEITATEI
ncbi:leucine zipper putative tumor suppressor 2a [Chanos chanos]|uniref:Leucine zipper putative tumor suppressor 2 homolog n=1 Tax=Chanos chanos TaxID=29144 RepID=A0A6J2V845_CHACN|nr:leucine zipper putative tumor suppressor 2 [Chanos chanos]